LFSNIDYFLCAYLLEAAMCFIFGSFEKSYTDKSSSPLARLIHDLDGGLFWRSSAAASPNQPMPAPGVAASDVSGEELIEQLPDSDIASGVASDGLIRALLSWGDWE
jgi:hypothetical protein